CYLMYDSDLFVRGEGNEVMPPAAPLPRVKTNTVLPADLAMREIICRNRLTFIRWSQEKNGFFVECPAKDKHTNPTADTHTILYINGVNITLDCQHKGACLPVVEQMNRLLRSEVSKSEFRPESPVSYPYRNRRLETPSVNGSEPVESKPLKDFVTFYSVSDVKSYVP